MRLSRIKLAGFKSFVDPTTVYIESNLVGVVGPNGSGKSNIIDAVRWVMGESSAKHMRGESMADVIFSGSSSRKPVGQAFVELVFDNSQSSMGGKYANYNEISIKRLVTRDGQSNYSLNGTRCRRRDITDIFLGTGLGPRSYAIIGQGMISRLIEAKPDELRTFLEEAAGISKYKERRRETENRMRHTHENLSRIDDLMDELDKQLERLQKQAKTAERYKNLKDEARTVKGQLLTLQWQLLDNEMQTKEALVGKMGTQLEADISALRTTEAAMEQQREIHVEASDTLNEIQARYYQIGAEVSSHEQQIQHTKNRQQELANDLAQVIQAQQDANVHQQTDERQCIEHEVKITELMPVFDVAKQQSELSSAQLEEADDAMQDWQSQWDEFNQQAGEPTKTAEVERTKITHMENQSQQLQQRSERLRDELISFESKRLDDELQALDEVMMQQQTQADQLHEVLSECQARVTDQRQEMVELTENLATSRDQHQQQRGRIASLEVLQEAALGQHEEQRQAWLSELGLQDCPRLAQQLIVSEGWEKAVETVLGFNLEALCINALPDIFDKLHELPELSIHFMAARSTSGHVNAMLNSRRLLSDVVQSPVDVSHLLDKIYCVDDLPAALALSQQLLEDESVVTRQGLWMSPRWLRINKQQDEKSGVIAREKELQALQIAQQQEAEVVAQLEQQCEFSQVSLLEIEAQRDNTQREIQESQKQLGEIKAQYSGKLARSEQIKTRSAQVRSELDDIQQQITNHVRDVQEARKRLAEALDRMDETVQRREVLTEQRDELRESLADVRQVANEKKQEMHDLKLRFESSKMAKEAAEQNLQRVHIQLRRLQVRQNVLETALTDNETPLPAIKQNLEKLLEQRLTVEAQLSEVRQGVGEADNQLRELSANKIQIEQKVQVARETLNQEQMNAQTVKVRRQTLIEQLSEAGYELAQILAELPEEASANAWEQGLAKLEQSIVRLGPINLAAIDEYAEQSERKQYLESQHNDLTEALTTLENAINKIDKETRARFKDTFDKVNDGLKNMFPKLFGGGQAFLELVSEDLLETGVTIMARPPGKRISNIHMLSGGEKALTAVALVFAIFELNPAPFCMLDEVDAPLDEANVGRFSQLVKAMSEQVQFIFITHNKTTMEIAQHLNGVTMHEPGVSRMVSVDVEEAASLAAM